MIAGVPAAEYHARYHRTRYDKAMAKLIAYLGGRCTACGTTEDLQFDHVDPEMKLFSITARWNRPFEEIRPELDKCQLLCRAHHDEKTRANGENASRRTYTCCGREWVGKAYGGHKRWCRN